MTRTIRLRYVDRKLYDIHAGASNIDRNDTTEVTLENGEFIVSITDRTVAGKGIHSVALWARIWIAAPAPLDNIRPANYPETQQQPG